MQKKYHAFVAVLAPEQAMKVVAPLRDPGGALPETFAVDLALGPDERAAWLGHAVAGSLEASVAGTGTGGCRFHDHLGHLLGIDVAAWWRPTAANFFDKVTKPVMFDALAEIDGPALAARYGNAKKADLAATCEKICAGDFIGEVSTKQAARAWLPAAMRFAPELARQAEGDPATLPGNADASATETERAAPPAPSTIARKPRRCIAASSGARKPLTSVFVPSHLPCSRRSVRNASSGA